MQPTEHPGVYTKNERLFTQNLETCRGMRVYNEQLFTEDNHEYRSWNPFRSKLAAALLKGLSVPLQNDSKVLYLGAATGTTVSHISDILTDGTVYAVESSPIALIMVKARSIDVALKPKQAYELVTTALKQQRFVVKKIVDLAPYEKDHAAILITH